MVALLLHLLAPFIPLLFLRQRSLMLMVLAAIFDSFCSRGRRCGNRTRQRERGQREISASGLISPWSCSLGGCSCCCRLACGAAGERHSLDLALSAAEAGGVDLQLRPTSLSGSGQTIKAALRGAGTLELMLKYSSGPRPASRSRYGGIYASSSLRGG